MKRKIVLFPLAALTILGLISCQGNSDDRSNSDASSSTTSSQSETQKKISVDKSEVTLEVGENTLVVATVEGTENTNKTWASSDPSVATVERGTITGIKEGTATISVSLDEDPTIKAEIAVTVVAAQIKIKSATVEQAASTNGGLAPKTLYRISGILEKFSSDDKYGNGYLTDPATGKTVQIYGMTGTNDDSCFDFEASSDSKFFKNPKDAKTSLQGVSSGELVTIKAGWCVFNGKTEIFGILESHEASDNKYTASFEANEHATISLDKVSDLAYGDVVTASVTPASGYVVDSVNVETLYGTFAAIKGTEDGKYTFNATCANKLIVTVSVPVTGEVDFDMTADGVLSQFNLNNQYNPADVTINGIRFKGTNLSASKYSGWDDNVLTLCAKNSTETLTISGKEFNSFSLTYKWWGNNLTLAVSSSTDGENWTSLLDLPEPSGVDYAEEQSFATGENFTTANYFRISLTTSVTKNQRVGIFNIKLGIAD